MDTLQASTELWRLREPCEARDSFMYNPNENPRERLRFKHIAMMCQYFTGHSVEYSLLGANCRWICYALLECLREAQPCYGGSWLPSRTDRPTADVRAAQLAKSHYLKDKHPTCCGSQYLAYPSFGVQVARATAGLAIASSSPNTGNRVQNANPDVIYRTPRSLPNSAVPHQPPTSTTNAGHQRFSPNEAPTRNTNSSNMTKSSPGPNVTQPGRQQNDVSPPPAGGNITQHPQSPSISEVSSGSQSQSRNATPPVPRSTGETAPHCSGCQCASHSGHRQSTSNEPQPSLLDLDDDTSGLSSQLSSMNIQPEMPAPEFSHGQWADEHVTIPRESSPREASEAPQCSCGGPHRNIPGQRPPSIPVPPAMPNATWNSPRTACPTHPGRIHPGYYQRSSTSSTGTSSIQRNGMPSMTTQRPSGYNRYPPPQNSSPSAHGSHIRRVSGANNNFNVPHQRPSQPPFTNPASSMAGGNHTVHHNRTPSMGTDYSGYDPRASVYTQECQHTHNHPLPRQSVDSLGSVPHGYSFPHANGAPRPRRTQEVPPTPPTHQGIRANTRTYPNQSWNGSRDPHQTTGGYTHGPDSPPQRQPANRNSFHQAQMFHDHMVPPSPGYNANVSEERYYTPQHNLYRISEDASQTELEHQYNLGSEPVGVDPSEYGAQPMASNYGSDQFTQFASDYPPSQHPDAAFQQSYMSNDPPTDMYSRPEPPNRQWTQEVWGGQESGLPMRTESPTQFDDDAYSMPQEPPTPTKMPDPRDYMIN
ncbi:unnamed protein product [Rhizoctonia solani]|uniref:Uncharacterized protein n=1 Tax=Rhizoctonia solani TaxID=456999 RepID=A0A8H2WVD7_9AGAM|nr:unnamed protein product [Rhizoctonia solani]